MPIFKPFSSTIVAAIINLGLLGLLVHSEPAWSQRKSGSIPRPVVAVAAKLMRATETVQLPGTVVARRSSRLSTAIGGLVQTIALDFGDRVKAGDVIVELDDSLAKHQLAQAQAAVEEAVADASEKRRLLTIGRNLTKRGVITKDQLNTRGADAQIAQAVVKKLRADVAGKRELVDRHRIVAPFDGVIATKLVEAGEWVAPGSAVVQLVSDQGLRVDVSVPQDYYGRLSDGTKVSLSFAAVPGKTFAAQRVATSPISDTVTRTFLLRIEPLPAKELSAVAPGMSAQAVLSLTTDEDAIVIPRDAVIRHPDGRTTVWVLGLGPGENGQNGEGGLVTVKETQVKLGQVLDDQVVVISGLGEADRVVVAGNESLQPGQRVRVSP